MKKAIPAAPLDVLQRYTVEEAIAYLRTSRRSFYKLITEGKIRTLSHGRRTYVHGSEIARFAALSH
jgi:excisionase family DNA binding protein